MKKSVPIYSIGNPGDLTYEYTVIGNKTDDIKKIINNEVEFSTDAVMNRSSFEPDSRIIASGFRNPWNFTLSNNRKFLVIPDVGWHDF